MSSISGKNLFSLFSGDPSIDSGIRSQISEHSSRIYTILENKEETMEELAESQAFLPNVYRTYTHSSYSQLSHVDKLKFQYAFIDLTDDVRSTLSESADVKESYQEQSIMAWIAVKVVDFIAGTDEP